MRPIVVAGIEMVYIPPGDFMMGSSSDDSMSRNEEYPHHEVKISSGFYLSASPITQQAFTNITGKNIADNRTSSFLPIESVNRYSACDFCSLLSKETDVPVRLPTEAEWEYACRAGVRSRYYWGDSPKDADAFAWHAGNSVGEIHPVGEKKPNPWGLYDMLGNVWEWCSDRYSHDSYRHSIMVNPQGPESGQRGCVRGGSFFNSVDRIRCASRGGTYFEVGRSRYGIRLCVSSKALPRHTALS